MLALPEWLHILVWWLIIQAVGLAALPVTLRLFRWLPERGYAFSKPVGLLLSTYLLWLGASTGFLRNDTGGIIFSILLVFVFSTFVILWERRHQSAHPSGSIFEYFQSHKAHILRVEILFAIAFIAWAILRAYAPDKIMNAGGEKYMEMAFLNGILNSPQFPPVDVWLSGFAISYYYFGYVMMALVTRLSGAPTSVGFELYDALLFALTFIGAFGVVFNLVASREINKPQRSSQAANFGLLGAVFVVLLGNLEGLLESLYSRGLLPEAFWNWINIPDLAGNPITGSWFPGGSSGWWWWRGSRVLQDLNLDHQPLGLSPITEFPFFSFLLGDNHPHVLALPFVLLGIGLSLNLLLRVFDHLKESSLSDPGAWWNPVQAVFGGDWFDFGLYALALGALGFLNTWDMPVYIGLATLAYGSGLALRHGSLAWTIIRQALALALVLLLASLGLYSLFYASFRSQAGGILPYVLPPTRLPQYLVMFGLFIFILLMFLIALTVRHIRQNRTTSLVKLGLRSWITVMIVCLTFFALLLSAILASGLGREMLASGQVDPVLQPILGNLSFNEALSAILSARLTNPWLFLLVTLLIGLILSNFAYWLSQSALTIQAPEKQSTTTLPGEAFVLVMIFTGLALTFSVEFVYLRDTFMARMNTVFKFYYQGWILMALSAAYGLWWITQNGSKVFGRLSTSLIKSIVIVLIAAGMVYPIFASYSRVAGFRVTPNLDGTSSLAAYNPDDWAAIAYLNDVARQALANGSSSLPVILEAPGKSYNYEGRISAFSGMPALLGWSLHESQWRGNYDEQGKREPDIDTIYTSGDAFVTLELLHKWDIDYVILGNTEMQYIQGLCQNTNQACNLSNSLRKFESTLEPVFQQGNTIIFAVP